MDTTFLQSTKRPANHRTRTEGGGPTLIECELDRYFGHFEGDAQTYRPRTK